MTASICCVVERTGAVAVTHTRWHLTQPVLPGSKAARHSARTQDPVETTSTGPV